MPCDTKPGVTASAEVPKATDAARASGEPLAAADFTACMRHIPGAVAILAVAGENGRQGLAVTSWCSLSAEPPSILVCVNQAASAYESIRRAGSFSLNSLATDQEELMAVFAGQRGVSGEARFRTGDWRTGSSGAPVLADAVASLECRLVEQYTHHSHSVFIGQVTAVHVRPEAEALVYARRAPARVVALA